MSDSGNAIDDKAAANTQAEQDRAPGQQHDAGQDSSIEKRMRKNPESKEARLDRALDESMDASDPPASTQPVHHHEPAPSSGYDAEAEKALQDGKS